MKTGVLILSLFFLNTSNFHKKEVRNIAKTFFKNPVGNVYIVVDKSDYELHVYDGNGWFATYPVVFGNKNLGDKKMEGDRNTPEGEFKIISKNNHNKWHKFISIDYPNEESWKKFKERKLHGEIPTSARIGGGIGIHGTWPHEDYQIDRYNDWTMGCISLKNEDIDHLYAYLKTGTTITIQK